MPLRLNIPVLDTFQLHEASPPWYLTRGSAPVPRWGLSPTPPLKARAPRSPCVPHVRGPRVLQPQKQFLPTTLGGIEPPDECSHVHMGTPVYMDCTTGTKPWASNRCVLSCEHNAYTLRCCLRKCYFRSVLYFLIVRPTARQTDKKQALFASIDSFPLRRCSLFYGKCVVVVSSILSLLHVCRRRQRANDNINITEVYVI